MSDGSVDPRWHDVLSLTAHEVRNPLGAVAGYVRMLLTGRVGPVSDKQRRMLEETAKVCGRISEVLNELSTLSDLEDGTAKFNRGTVNVNTLLRDAIAALPEDPDRNIAVELSADGAGALHGDATRLRAALMSVFHALRRELVTSDRLCVRQRVRDFEGRKVAWIVVADPEKIDRVASTEPDQLTTFDEWRGGCGLSLPVARRVIVAHGGRIWSPVADDHSKPSKAGAVIALPLS